MSVRATTAVWFESKSTGNDRLVLLAIADCANDDLWAWPGIDYVSRKTRLARRTVIYIISRLEELGELLVDPNSGPKGTNRYQILVGTNGAYNPPERGGAASCTGANGARVQLAAPPSAKNPRKTSVSGLSRVQQLLHSADCTPSFAPDPSLTGTPPPPAPAAGPVEWPSEEQVAAHGRAYGGNMAKGIPAVMPEGWVNSYFGWRTFRLKGWIANWREEMVWRFERNWQDGEPKARGKIAENLTHQPGSKNSVWALKQKLEQLKSHAATHPANDQSSSWLGEPTPAEQNEWSSLKEEIRKTEQQIREAKI